MGVEVDQAGGHVIAADVNRLGCIRGFQMFADGSNLPILDANVHWPVDVVLGVNHVTVLQQEIVGQRIR